MGLHRVRYVSHPLPAASHLTVRQALLYSHLMGEEPEEGGVVRNAACGAWQGQRVAAPSREVRAGFGTCI